MSSGAFETLRAGAYGIMLSTAVILAGDAFITHSEIEHAKDAPAELANCEADPSLLKGGHSLYSSTTYDYFYWCGDRVVYGGEEGIDWTDAIHRADQTSHQSYAPDMVELEFIIFIGAFTGAAGVGIHILRNM